MKIYIHTPDYINNTGGIVSLHLLGHRLSQLGEEVILFCKIKNNDWLGKIYDGHIIDLKTSVVIYPETVSGNPNNFKHIVRWILNTPGICGGDGIFNDTDLIYKYSAGYIVKDESLVKGILCIFESEKLKDYVDYNRHIKNKTCYLVRKGGYKKLDKHPSTAIQISDQPIEEIIELFNTCETFISYDHNTYYSIIAVLCGCISIVIPDESMTKDMWIKNCAMYPHGIMYGLDAITTTDNTRKELLECIEQMHKRGINQIQTLIKDIKQLIYGV